MRDRWESAGEKDEVPALICEVHDADMRTHIWRRECGEECGWRRVLLHDSEAQTDTAEVLSEEEEELLIAPKLLKNYLSPPISIRYQQVQVGERVHCLSLS